MPIDKQGLAISNLAEVRSELRKLGATEDLKEIRAALLAGAEIVAEEARRRVTSRVTTETSYVRVRKDGQLDRRYKQRTTTSATKNAKGSIRATASGNRAFVNGGKSTIPYYGWLDFGSRTPITGRPRSVGPWKGSGKGPERGRFIYPALDATRDEVVEKIAEGIDAYTRRRKLQ